MHRKNAHKEAIVFKCRNFIQGNCKFDAKDCWYQHDSIENSSNEQNNCKISDNEQSNEKVFLKVSETMKPPDMIAQILKMVEDLSQKVQTIQSSMNQKQ